MCVELGSRAHLQEDYRFCLCPKCGTVTLTWGALVLRFSSEGFQSFARQISGAAVHFQNQVPAKAAQKPDAVA
jgi:hypothetical protein